MADRTSRRNRRGATPYERPGNSVRSKDRRRTVIGWVGETVRDMFAAPSWVSDMWKSPVALTLGEHDADVKTHNGHCDDDPEVIVDEDENDVHPIEKYPKQLASNTSSKFNIKTNFDDDADCLSVASSSTGSSLNPVVNQVKEPPAKRGRVSFRDTHGAPLHTSMISNEPFSLSFNASTAITPQRPLAQSMFYSHATRFGGANTSLVDLSVTSSPRINELSANTSQMSRNSSAILGTSSPVGRNSRLVRRNSLAVPLSGNATKILRNMEQPLSHTQISIVNRMSGIPSDIQTKLPGSPNLRHDRAIKSADAILNDLPSFSFLTCKRDVKLNQKLGSALPIKERPFKDSRDYSFAESAPLAAAHDEEVTFSFSQPTPRKFALDDNHLTDADRVNGGINYKGGKESTTLFSSRATLINTADQPGKQTFTQFLGKSMIETPKTTDNPSVGRLETPSIFPPNNSFLKDKFKPSVGSWECNVCLVLNKSIDKSCVACASFRPSMDAVGGTSSKTGSTKLSEMFKQPTGTWSCSVCLVSNTPGTEKYAACESLAPKGNIQHLKPSTVSAAPNVKNTLSDMFKAPSGSWECSTCLVQNKALDNKCVACETAKPSSAKDSVLCSSNINSSFLSQKFKQSAGTWNCDVCLVSNAQIDITCAACESPKPAATVHGKIQPSSSFLQEKFAVQDGSWTCDTCLVKNKTTESKCAACETPNKTSMATHAAKISAPSLLGQMFKPSGDTWECDVCLVRNKNDDTHCAACGEGNSKGGITGTKKRSNFSSNGSFSAFSDNTGGSKPAFTFGQTNKSDSNSAFTFGKSTEQVDCKSAPLISVGTTNALVSKTGFSFGEPLVSNNNVTAPQFKFGSASQSPPMFGAFASNSSSTGFTVPTFSASKSDSNGTLPAFTFGNKLTTSVFNGNRT